MPDGEACPRCGHPIAKELLNGRKTKMNEQNLCIQCGKKLEAGVYAVYKGKEQKAKEDSEDQVIGFLCENCREKLKIKGIRNRNELQKLEKLKNLLKFPPMQG